MKRLAIGLLVTLCSLLTASAAEKPWASATTAHFTVVADTNIQTARDIAWQFEQVRFAIQKLWPWAQTDLDRPVLVLAVDGENKMKMLAPQFWEQKDGLHPGSVNATGFDRYYIALRSDIKADPRQGTVNPYLNAYWSYTSVVLGRGFRRQLPLWFVRGVGALMGNTIIRESSLQVGHVVPWLMQRLKNGERPKLRELLTADRSSDWSTNAKKLEQFDAEAWMFAHFLMLGDEGGHRPMLERYTTLLTQGQTAEEAVSAFGDLDALTEAFNIYYNRPIFQLAGLDVDVSIKRDAFQAGSFTPAEVRAAEASLHIALRRPVEARAAIADAKKADPALPAVAEAEALLLDREGKLQEARTAYAAAMAQQSSNPYVYFRWAALTWNPQVDAATRVSIEQALERSTKMNDRYPQAYALWAAVKTQSGHASEALPLAQRAVTLDPDQTGPRVTMTRVLLALSRRDEAKEQAAAALELAKTDVERRNALQVVDLSK